MSKGEKQVARELNKVAKNLAGAVKSRPARKRRARPKKKVEIVVRGAQPGRNGGPSIPPRVIGSVPRALSAEAQIGSMMNAQQRKALYGWLKSVMTGSPIDAHQLIPREIPLKVSPAPIKHVMNLPYMNYVDGSTDPRQGVAGVEVYRSLSAPCRVWTVADTAAVTTFQSAIDGQKQWQGLWPDNDNILDEGLLNLSMEVDSADTLNIVGLVTHGAVGRGTGSFMRKAVCAVNGSVFYGFPMDLTGTTSLAVNLQLRTSKTFTTGFIPQLRLISTSGVTAWVDGGIGTAAGDSYLAVAVTFPTATSDLGGVYSCCLPGKPMGIQIRSKNSTEFLSYVGFNLNSSATAKLGWMEPQALDDIGEYDWVQSSNFANLRAWIEYVGTDLLNSGTISAATCPGGAPPSLLGYCDYASVADTTGAYIDAVKKGGWSFWKPQTAADFDMLPKNDALGAALRTSFVMWCKIGSPPTGQSGATDSLNLIIEGNIEGTTRNITRPLVECVANPLALTLGLALLYHIKAHMENPLHWKDITHFLSRAASTIKGGAEFVAKNKDWLIPAAVKVAGAAGIALL